MELYFNALVLDTLYVPEQNNVVERKIHHVIETF